MRELPEKYKRMNKQYFKEAKLEFEKRFGKYFTCEKEFMGRKTRCDGSEADFAEHRLEALIGRYKNREIGFWEGVERWMDLIGIMFCIEDDFVCNEWVATTDETLLHYEMDKDTGCCLSVTIHKIDEAKQAARIRQLFVTLLEVAGRLAHELKSDTYTGWRELFLVASEDAYRGRVVTDDLIEEVTNKFGAFRDLHRKLWADLQIMGKANAPKRELGEWAKRFVADYDAKHGFVELTRGQQRSFRIPEKSVKAWDVLTRLFTANDPEGWTKLPPNWKSHFIRKIGSTSEIDKDSDLVKIAAFIRPHTPGKGRASDGKYRFEPVRLVRENLK